MIYLLDSHIFVWLLYKPELVGKATKSLLNEADVQVFVSHASFWELELKHSKGRFLHSSKELSDGLVRLGVSELAISMSHILSSADVGIEHNDPFDLMLCAQATSEDMILVTADKTLLNVFPNSIDAKL